MASANGALPKVEQAKACGIDAFLINPSHTTHPAKLRRTLPMRAPLRA